VRVERIVVLAATIGVGCSASPLQVLDGGFEAGGDTDSAASNPPSCTVVLASGYDQSCMVDTDCVTVYEVHACPITDCSGCAMQGINKGAMTQYMSALSKNAALEPSGVLCHCPCESGFAICRGGQCQAAPCAPSRADTLAACANAGGLCGYRANTTCGGTGTADGCAYSDEICCLN
jgi:hypothetical protein